MRPDRTVALLLTLVLALAACDGGGDPVDLDDPGADPDEADPGDDGTAQEAEGGTLIAGLGGEPDQLDPHLTTSTFSFTILENVYDTLVQTGDDLSIEPALATEWETSDDGLEWTFTLREGVTFHDGSELTAEDVVASLERIAEEGQNSFRLDPVEEYEATDEHTVTLRLSEPSANLLTQLGQFKGMAIAPAEAIEAGTLGDEPVGTGPFQLDSGTPGDVIEITRFDDYWGEGPLLDAVEFRVIPDEGTKLTNLQTGEVHWIDSVPPDQLEALEGDDQLVIDRIESNDYWYLALNNEREPFDDPDVRRAIAFALDPEVIAEAARFDAATPNETAIPEASFWYHDYAPFGYDPDQAQQLLDEAGVEGLSIDLMVTNEFPETVTVAQVIENQLGEVGIDVEIRTEDFTTWLGDQGEGEFDAFMLGWLGNIDPDDFYYAQHHSAGNNNFHGFADDEVDQLLDQGRSELDEDARKEIYDQAQERIVDLASYIYFYNPDLVEAWVPAVQGYEVRADQANRFVGTSLEE